MLCAWRLVGMRHAWKHCQTQWGRTVPPEKPKITWSRKNSSKKIATYTSSWDWKAQKWTRLWCVCAWFLSLINGSGGNHTGSLGWHRNVISSNTMLQAPYFPSNKTTHMTCRFIKTLQAAPKKSQLVWFHNAKTMEAFGWNISHMLHPPKMNECPMKRDHFKRNAHLPTIKLSGDMWVFGKVSPLPSKLVISSGLFPSSGPSCPML